MGASRSIAPIRSSYPAAAAAAVRRRGLASWIGRNRAVTSNLLQGVVRACDLLCQVDYADLVRYALPLVTVFVKRECVASTNGLNQHSSSQTGACNNIGDLLSEANIELLENLGGEADSKALLALLRDGREQFERDSVPPVPKQVGLVDDEQHSVRPVALRLENLGQLSGSVPKQSPGLINLYICPNLRFWVFLVDFVGVSYHAVGFAGALFAGEYHRTRGKRVGILGWCLVAE